MPGEDTDLIKPLVKEFWEGDLTRPDTLRGLADGTDVIYHLAGRVKDWGKRELFYSIILDGTKHLFEEGVGQAGRFVFVSSMAACGLGRHLKGFKETDQAVKSGVPYNDAKLEAEDFVRAGRDRYERGVVIVRPANVIGPGSVWVREVAERFMKTGVPLIDGGRYSASLVYVENLVDGILLCDEVEAASGETYQFRDDWEVTWKRYLTDLGAIVGKKPSISLPYGLCWAMGSAMEALLTPLGWQPPLTRLAVAVTGRDNDVDNAKAKEELGWQTRVGYEEGMSEIQKWVEANLP